RQNHCKNTACSLLTFDKRPLILYSERICSVPSQIRAKIHLKSTPSMGFWPASLGFHTVSAASAQT
ncbi:hypothetical protein, partial [Enterocloster lavalensis]|uniref:hypothetical protein n=1 Tax=Enterocloster lavalensis TaxID=460384 RepID=UPI002FDAC82F